MTDKIAIARALREIGTLLQIKGENPFKVRAYETGARAVEALSEDVGILVAEGRLESVRGIGKALAAKITELHQSGRLGLLERLRAELPPGIVELSRIPDLGPKKVAALHAALGITSVAELKAACEAKRVREVKGFGARTEERILQGIAALSTRRERTLLSEALALGEPLLLHLRQGPGVVRADIAGSARRWQETVADLDLLAGAPAVAPVMDHLAGHPLVAGVEARGETKCTLRLSGGMQVDLRVVPPEDYATALHHFTGGKSHHVKLRGLARERGLTLSEWGVHTLDEPPRKLPTEDEAALYRHMGMSYVPPELREDQGEIEAALEGSLPTDLLEMEDIQGLVHCHTVFSDGRGTVEEMARAADEMGMRYLTITDHSPTAGYAGGLTLDRLKQQWEEIARVQQKVKVRLLRGTESDILEDGALDYPDAVLERFEVIIASVHARHKMDEVAMTRRLVRAMRQPVFKIWGHALGRLLLRREPFACRVEEVLDAVAESRAAVEINGDPHRLDLEPRWVRAARERGIRFAVSVDAHSPAALQHLRYGVGLARRGWVRRDEVLNTLPTDAFLAAVRPTRSP